MAKPSHDRVRNRAAFEDGNGRTARALFYWAMLSQGHWLFEFISISRLLREAPAQYARAFLFAETDGNDSTYFVLHQLKVIERALRDLEAYLEKKVDTIHRTARTLRKIPDLNHRQLALMGHALKHMDAVYTFANHASRHGVVYQTARTDLLGLADRGFLVKIRRGRSFNFMPAEDLDSRIEAAR